MSEFGAYIAGAFVAGFYVGVGLMCALALSKRADEQQERGG